MTSTIEELDISQLFDESIECEFDECVMDAEWALKRLCCKHPTLCCTPHKEHCLKIIEQYKIMYPFAVLYCPYCDGDTPVDEGGYEVERL